MIYIVGYNLKLKMPPFFLDMIPSFLDNFNYEDFRELSEACNQFAEIIISREYNFFDVLDYLGFLREVIGMTAERARLLFAFYVQTFVNVIDYNVVMLPSIWTIFNISYNFLDISAVRQYFAENGIFVVMADYILGVWPNMWSSTTYNVDDDLVFSTRNDIHSTFRMLSDFAHRYQHGTYYTFENFQNSFRSVYDINNHIVPVSEAIRNSTVFQFITYINATAETSTALHDWSGWLRLFLYIIAFEVRRQAFITAFYDPEIRSFINLVVIELRGVHPYVPGCSDYCG